MPHWQPMGDPVMDDVEIAVDAERERCVLCCDMAIEMLSDECRQGLVAGLLYRARNQIAGGQAPITLQQQLLGDDD